MLPPIIDVTHITLAHCDPVGRGYPTHQFSVTINTLFGFEDHEAGLLLLPGPAHPRLSSPFIRSVESE